ncbi:MAG: hypothetical protein ACRD1L_10550, partial [Terriglobales bacterium]
GQSAAFAPLGPSFDSAGDATFAARITVPTGVVINGGAQLSTSNQTGTGNIVLASSPTIASPTLTGITTAATVNATTLEQGGVGVFSADINSSDQVIATHLTSPLPLAQGGTGAASLAAAGIAANSQLPLSGSVAGSTTSLAANSCGDSVTATVTGAGTSMVATASVEGALPTAGLVVQAAVTSANTVTAEYCNVTTSAVVPAAATIALRVVQ